MKFKLNLPRTWLIDLDGTVVKHNAYLDSGDELLTGVREFWSRISHEDRVVLITARSSRYQDATQKFLQAENLRYDLLIMDMPSGERILVNDCKPDGTITAYAFNVERDQGLGQISLDF